ncbi:MAG: hypothetical protein ACJ8GN_02060 [Longimicrobiaceae bacterium]
MPPAVTLWRSKRDGRPRGFIRASWRQDGQKVTWDTRSLDEGEAKERALAEIARRLSATQRPVKPESEATPIVMGERQPPGDPGERPSNVIPMRRPIGEAVHRALGGPAVAAPAPAEPPADHEARAKAKKLYEVFGRAMGMATEGGLKRLCRWAGREPEEMDDNEIAMVREGWEEKGAEWFGRVEIGPWGKIALGTGLAGFGMYVNGKVLEEQKKLPAKPADGADGRPERDAGGGGG